MDPAGTPSDRPHAGRRAAAPRGQAGISIMEILVALFLLVLIVVGVSRTMTGAKRVQVGSYAMEQASSFAQGKMNQLSAASLATVAPGSDTVKTPLGMKFSRTWTVVDLGGTRNVEVTVAWNAGGKAHAVKLGTLVR